ncbi:MAG: hypothetical protein LBQ66_14610 [Planctomycetaceae bacterium]|nr:hypothetical protein [Planctomycetaceae bacterium]
MPVRFGDPVVGLCRRYSPRKPGGRLPTLRLPTRLGVPSKLVWFPNAQRRAGRPRSSPRRFAAVVCLSADGGRGKPMCVSDPVVGER